MRYAFIQEHKDRWPVVVMADLLVRSYVHTFGLPALITRCSNNYGPYQFPEKLIPLFITNLLRDEAIPVYGDGQQIRDWIHVRDHCRAMHVLLRTFNSHRHKEEVFQPVWDKHNGG